MAEVNVPITKAKATIAVNTDLFPEEVWNEIVLQGLKVVLNRGTSKLTKAAVPNEEEFKAQAMAIATTQLENALAGKLKITGGKAKKASGAVMTEARRLAKALVKDAIKAAGGKVSHYEASEITKAANALLDSDSGKEILAQAEANIAERSKTPISINVGDLIKPSDKLVAKATAANEKKKSQLSAKQAGMTAKAKKSSGAQATA